MVNGDRRQFAGWNGKVATGKWHELAVEAQGDHFQVFYDGKKVIDAHDKTFTDAGKFGIWTKADSVIQFDDLTATPKTFTDKDGKEVPVTSDYSPEIGKVVATVEGASATYTLTGKELYVRAKVTSSKPHPNPYAKGDVEVAWTQPVVP